MQEENIGPKNAEFFATIALFWSLLLTGYNKEEVKEEFRKENIEFTEEMFEFYFDTASKTI